MQTNQSHQVHQLTYQMEAQKNRKHNFWLVFFPQQLFLSVTLAEFTHIVWTQLLEIMQETMAESFFFF